MGQKTIDRLVICKPYEEPERHWLYDRETREFCYAPGRRPAGYLKATPNYKGFDDPGIFVELPLVNRIRQRVKAWQEAGYPGVTSITRRLLEYWTDPEESGNREFFFCQLEAARTLIWLTEAHDSEKVGLEIPGDGGDFPRLCAKMATGTGKTVVMAMVIAWHILNKATFPQDARFSRNVLVVAPGLTVRNRLSVLHPSADGNFYEGFGIVPPGLMDKLRQGKVQVRNWHALNWESEEQIARKRSVDKRGVKSDAAYARDVLGELANVRNLLVINDEAHHAWRMPAGATTRGIDKTELDQATKWVGGLDRIHRARGILSCYDFSATPFVPSGRNAAEENLFSWVVSDFGLNDAIESGLVKTPRVVVRDDAGPDPATYKSRLYHIYNDPEVRDDLNQRVPAHAPLPDLVANAYYLLGYDWQDAAQNWQKEGHPTPPVMITVANRTETAARINHFFTRKQVAISELCAPDGILHIDSNVLKRAEESDEPVAQAESGPGGDGDDDGPRRPPTAQQRAEHLRRKVDTVGKPGQPGERVRNVISVGMLSEGWDAKTVTHIMGLRAFSSQLLCEQVVGRGLRRTSYEVNRDGMFDPEYVNIFGIPFTFLPHESDEGETPKPPASRTLIGPVPEKASFEITWPNILRIEHVYRPNLSLDWENLQSLELNASNTPSLAELAPIVDGKPDYSQVSSIDLEELARGSRTQTVVFRTARDIYDQMQPSWPGNRGSLIAQLVKLVERFIGSGRLQITPELFNDNEVARRLVITLNMTRVVQHVWQAVRFENTERLEPVFDPERPIRSTANMPTWYTAKPCHAANRSHVNMCVYDSTWEASEAFELDRNPDVESWVKNDHLGFEVLYIYRGIVRKYRPDFIIRLKSGRMLALETKGRQDAQSAAKRRALDEWVRAVNRYGGFGRWAADVSVNPADVQDILAKRAATPSNPK